MLILDFRTGKMTKLALDFGDVASVAIPGALLGLGGVGLGSLIDMLAGTKRRWTTILGLTGLAGGAGLGGLGRYLYKRDPTYQTFVFLDKAFTSATESDVQKKFGNNPDAIAAHQTRINNMTPTELINSLIEPMYKDFWGYNPDVLDFQVARYLVSKQADNAKLTALNIAVDIAVRGRLLSRYQKLIPEDLRPEIEKHFMNYAREMTNQFASANPNWEVPKSHLQTLVGLLVATNQEKVEKLAKLVANPYSVRDQS